MVFGIRDTAVMLRPLTEALFGGATWYLFHGWPAYQYASQTEPSAPIHQTSMLFVMSNQ